MSGIENILRREVVRFTYGYPPWATFYDRMRRGLIPPPDVMLGEQTPGRFESTIARDLKEKRKRGVPIAQRREQAAARTAEYWAKRAADQRPAATGTKKAVAQTSTQRAKAATASRRAQRHTEHGGAEPP